jgi:toxin ParE1/3/4
MADYKLSNTAKEDLIRIHHFGEQRFGEQQAEKYLDSLFKHFEIIAQRPFGL